MNACRFATLRVTSFSSGSGPAAARSSRPRQVLRCALPGMDHGIRRGNPRFRFPRFFFLLLFLFDDAVRPRTPEVRDVVQGRSSKVAPTRCIGERRRCGGVAVTERKAPCRQFQVWPEAGPPAPSKPDPAAGRRGRPRAKSVSESEAAPISLHRIRRAWRACPLSVLRRRFSAITVRLSSAVCSWFLKRSRARRAQARRECCVRLVAASRIWSELTAKKPHHRHLCCRCGRLRECGAPARCVVGREPQRRCSRPARAARFMLGDLTAAAGASQVDRTPPPPQPSISGQVPP